jgi:glycosyltransferase involved in cell wall biosynthesis
MSVFNDSKYLEQSIKSILKQSYSNFEFIIIDDGSKDKTYEIVNRNMKMDNRIKFFRRDHYGLASSLNFGISKAKGKYIARMDADDISHYKRFEKQVHILKNQDVDIVGSNITYIDTSGKSLGEKICFPKNDIEIKWNLLFTNPIAHSTVMMKKSIFTNRVSYNVDYKYSQDYALWNKLSKNYKFYNIQEILLKFRLKNDNVKINSQMDYIIKSQKSLLSQVDSDISNEKTRLFNTLINNKLKSKNEFQLSFQILKKITRSFILRSQIRSINECYRIHTLFPNTFKKVLINNGQLSFFLSLQIIGILVYYNSNVLLTKDFWWSIKIWVKKILNIAITNVSKSKTIINRNILYKPKKGIT